MMTSAEKRTRILAAAERVLRSKGLAGTTTREIVREAGVAEGTLYLYFKNRAELFLAIFDEHLAPFARPLQSLAFERSSEPPETVLLDVATRFLRFHHDVAPLLASLFAEPELQQAYRAAVLSRSGDAPRVMPPLVAYLRAQQRLGTIKRVDPAVIGEALLGACFSRAFHDAFFDDQPNEAAERKFLRALIRALIS
jgi:AcrR family transcriptional regulator